MSRWMPLGLTSWRCDAKTKRNRRCKRSAAWVMRDEKGDPWKRLCAGHHRTAS